MVFLFIYFCLPNQEMRREWNHSSAVRYLHPNNPKGDHHKLKCSIAFCVCATKSTPELDLSNSLQKQPAPKWINQKRRTQRLKAISTWMATRMCEKAINLFQSKQFFLFLLLQLNESHEFINSALIHSSIRWFNFSQYLFRAACCFAARFLYCFEVFREGWARESEAMYL